MVSSTFFMLLMMLIVVTASDDSSIADLVRDYRLLQARVADLEESSRGLQTVTNDGLAASTNTIWLIVCGALVMFMQAGFASLEAGAVRVYNVQNILLKNLIDVCVGTLFWWAFGFAIAYGYGESHGFFGRGLTSWPADGSNVPVAGEYALKDWFFQWAFSATAATIVSGGVAERVNSVSYFVYSAIMTGFIYPFIVAWGWSGEFWLTNDFDSPYFDFAGSGIIHLTGGTGALVGAFILGPRKGRFDPRVDQAIFDPHSIPLIVIGVFILWFGWFGFNAGSTLTMSDAATAHTAALAAVNTVLSGASGGFTLFIIRFGILPSHKFDVAAVCNGILAGLVSITASCAIVIPGSAIIIGAIGGIFYQCAAVGIRYLKIDDPLDAFPIHGVCGTWGVLAVPFFDFAKGMSSMSFAPNVGAGYQFGIQLLAVVAIMAYVGGCSIIVFGVMRFLKIFRVHEDHEVRGYDLSAHNPHAAYQLDGKHARSPSTDEGTRPQAAESLPGIQMVGGN
ncbi:Ammonium transporter, putative [Perkinsus marinus ATCC 50983]|uniref:Ammonium transporter n=1 Tax=Perkinsus marinus (strain ATCC 50983 / TXsc) TaxID=423536 RepID=C5KTM6_PERM5|nr:Ammonium transporter, putative [Perkinsus marinus ATCC 50983]EER12205.1 Ammonium transporter, putative [Perkinsus marinus ATCC 50983]|eukprot:XP_002780410.1 Ammonium transporter, putative [Perkinsus marinus ATCC 50983]